MIVELNDIGKRFNYNWIFRNLSINLEQPGSHAILGSNGSGKSTLMKIISGALAPSEGSIGFVHSGKKIPNDEIYKYISYSAPYMDLIESLRISEQLDFHFKFKKIIDSVEKKAILDLIGLEKHANKLVAECSSGMKQRIKLGLALLTDVPMVLLDEPCTNLDEAGVKWYQELIEAYSRDRLLVVASNQKHEYEFCENQFTLT